jgi:phage shock protein A
MAGLFTRVSSAISASIHDALDGVESPDSVIRQLIRESTDNITRARTLAIEAVASEKRLGNEIEQHELSMDKWATAAKSAMNEADEHGARHALSKKIE